MTTLENTIEKTKVNAKSVLEKLKSIPSMISKTTTNEVNKLSSLMRQESGRSPPNNISYLVSDISEKPKKNSNNIILRVIEYIFIILLIGFILLNILAYFQLLPYNLAKFVGFLLVVQDSSPSPPTGKASIDKIKTSVKRPKERVNPIEDEASSDIQESNKSKAGYCYVGKDRGYRSCVKVTEDTECMSGDIFPTRDVCINPKLRQ
jgi:hypothetical protein